MAGMDGWAGLTELKSQETLRDISGIMLSIVDDKSLAYALGATEFLTKPVGLAELRRLLAIHASRAA